MEHGRFAVMQARPEEASTESLNTRVRSEEAAEPSSTKSSPPKSK